MLKRMEPVGRIDHYFTKLNVAVVELISPLRIGDQIALKRMTTDFEQSVNSIQIDREEIKEAKKGDSVGLKVKSRVREGDMIYRIIE